LARASRGRPHALTSARRSGGRGRHGDAGTFTGIRRRKRRTRRKPFQLPRTPRITAGGSGTGCSGLPGGPQKHGWARCGSATSSAGAGQGEAAPSWSAIMFACKAARTSRMSKHGRSRTGPVPSNSGHLELAHLHGAGDAGANYRHSNASGCPVSCIPVSRAGHDVGRGGLAAARTVSLIARMLATTGCCTRSHGGCSTARVGLLARRR